VRLDWEKAPVRALTRRGQPPTLRSVLRWKRGSDSGVESPVVHTGLGHGRPEAVPKHVYILKLTHFGGLISHLAGIAAFEGCAPASGLLKKGLGLAALVAFERTGAWAHLGATCGARFAEIADLARCLFEWSDRRPQAVDDRHLRFPSFGLLLAWSLHAAQESPYTGRCGRSRS